MTRLCESERENVRVRESGGIYEWRLGRKGDKKAVTEGKVRVGTGDG